MTYIRVIGSNEDLWPYYKVHVENRTLIKVLVDYQIERLLMNVGDEKNILEI